MKKTKFGSGFVLCLLANRLVYFMWQTNIFQGTQPTLNRSIQGRGEKGSGGGGERYSGFHRRLDFAKARKFGMGLVEYPTSEP